MLNEVNPRAWLKLTLDNTLNNPSSRGSLQDALHQDNSLNKINKVIRQCFVPNIKALVTIAS